MFILRVYIVMLLAVSLAGCATLPDEPSAGRAQSISEVTAWDIQAVMAVSTHAGSEGGSVNLQWQQRQQNYTMLLFGPLGTGLIKITGQPGNVVLETADGKKVSAASPTLLLAQQTGWQLPVSNLYYWIRGLPAPTLPARKQFDRYHHLVCLSQDGWTVDFLRYNTVNQLDVPVKIVLQNWRIKVKIIIYQWKF